MQLITFQRRLFSVLLLALSFFAAPASAQQTGPVVLAAASLQEALTEAADVYAKARHPRPVLSFAGSSALARQIEAGAPADMFLSADEAWMDYVDTRHLLRAGSRKDFLTNRLVLIAPAAKPLKLAIRTGFPLARALGNSRLAMADPVAVPAGRYGRAALEKLGVWTQVSDKVASAENVRAALQLVARGEAAAGIVYATDARASKDVTVVGLFPANSHPPITYPLAILATSRNPDAARFRAFLLSAQGKAIFRKYGFGTR
jgi:molybdate transport system substrate-binding protein